MSLANGGKAISSKKRFPLESMTRLEDLDINVFRDELTCSLLDIRLPYTRDAMEELRSKLTEKLAVDRVYVIGRVKIVAPRDVHIVLDTIRSLSVQVEKIEIDSSLEYLENSDWTDKALSFDPLESFKVTLSEANSAMTDIIKSIVDRSLSVRKLSITLKDEGMKRSYIDKHFLKDDYLLNLTKTMKEEVNLEFRASLLTPNGMVAVVEEISNRTHDTKLSLLIYNSENAREIKAKILEEWSLEKVIDREFKPRNRARKEPVVHDQYVLFNDGESFCVFNGRVLLTMPTEQQLDGEQWNWRLPFAFSIERVMEKSDHSALNQDSYDVNRK